MRQVIAALLVLGLGACSGEQVRPRDDSPEPSRAEPAIDAAASARPQADAAVTKEPEVLVDVSKRIPDAVLDIRYATANNFVGVVLYPKAMCLLRPEVASKLARAAELLRADGYRLRLWDCYRPFSVQEALYRKVADPRYVGEPKRGPDGTPVKGSRHNRGAAVDLSLVTADGKNVQMPTEYDDFSKRAHRSALSEGGPGAKNAKLLEAAMKRAGFVGLPTEWWHFDADGWKSYPLLDVPLEER